MTTGYRMDTERSLPAVARVLRIGVLRGLPPLPQDLLGNEVRLVAEQADGISIIFIGGRSYQGLWISRAPMPGAVESVPGLSDQFMQTRYAGRVAVQCYHQR